MYPFIGMVALVLVLFCLLFVSSLPQWQVSTSSSHSARSHPPLQAPGGQALAPLQLSASQRLLYQQGNAIFEVPTHGGVPRKLSMPGYLANRAVPPLLTPAGQLLYSGDGIWLLNLSTNHAQQLATLPANQLITSLVLSSDGTRLAWSSAPANGSGVARLYAGSLETSTVLYQQAMPCHLCLRAFAFLTDQTLLATNDEGDTGPLHYGLWSIDLTGGAGAQPHQLMPADPPQGPLALSSSSTPLLAYSSMEGAVALPTDGSTPSDIAPLSYANDLNLASLQGQQLGAAQTLVAAQGQQSNTAADHWIMPPLFTPDGQGLVYIQFSSENQPPFTRHSALYMVTLHGSGAQVRADTPQLLATATSAYIELGNWLDDHTLSFYADNALYAFDIQQQALARIVQTGAYARSIAVLDSNGVGA